MNEQLRKIHAVGPAIGSGALQVISVALAKLPLHEPATLEEFYKIRNFPASHLEETVEEQLAKLNALTDDNLPVLEKFFGTLEQVITVMCLHLYRNYSRSSVPTRMETIVLEKTQSFNPAARVQPERYWL